MCKPKEAVRAIINMKTKIGVRANVTKQNLRANANMKTNGGVRAILYMKTNTFLRLRERSKKEEGEVG